MAEVNYHVRYSESFKMQVISELESGKLDNMAHARRHYGIGGSLTINGWLKKYGRNDLMPKVVRVEKPGEADQTKELKDQIKQLKEVLADTHVDGLLYKAHFEILCEEMGLDPDEYKKKTRHRASEQTVEAPAADQAEKVTVRRVCKRAGMTRQNYYKGRKVRQKRHIDKELVLGLIQAERALQPQLGCRKVLSIIQPELKAAGVNLGRDNCFAIMKENDLLIKRRKRSVTTTNSRHNFRVYGNLLKDADLTGPNQALVSDITYIRTDEGFLYLALVMDSYSRKIVGYDCSDTLEADGCLRALSQAIRQLPSGSNAIHHSDRGSQYCCHRYVNKLKGNGLQVSMTVENHCYENAQAERLNGILKQEYGLGGRFLKKQHVYTAVRQAIELYNTRRPHLALAYQTPAVVHEAA